MISGTRPRPIQYRTATTLRSASSSSSSIRCVRRLGGHAVEFAILVRYNGGGLKGISDDPEGGPAESAAVILGTARWVTLRRFDAIANTVAIARTTSIGVNSWAARRCAAASGPKNDSTHRANSRRETLSESCVDRVWPRSRHAGFGRVCDARSVSLTGCLTRNNAFISGDSMPTMSSTS